MTKTAVRKISRNPEKSKVRNYRSAPTGTPKHQVPPLPSLHGSYNVEILGPYGPVETLAIGLDLVTACEEAMRAMLAYGMGWGSNLAITQQRPHTRWASVMVTEPIAQGRDIPDLLTRVQRATTRTRNVPIG